MHWNRKCNRSVRTAVENSTAVFHCYGTPRLRRGRALIPILARSECLWDGTERAGEGTKKEAFRS